MEKYGLDIYRQGKYEVVEISFNKVIITVCENKQRQNYEKFENCPLAYRICLSISMIRDWKSFSCKYCYFDIFSNESMDFFRTRLIQEQLEWLYAFAPLASTFLYGSKSEREEESPVADIIQTNQFAKKLVSSVPRTAEKQFLENPRIELIRNTFAKHQEEIRKKLLSRSIAKPEANQTDKIPGKDKDTTAFTALQTASANTNNCLPGIIPENMDSSQGNDGPVYLIMQNEFILQTLPAGIEENGAIDAFTEAQKKVLNLKLFLVESGNKIEILP